MKYLVDTHTFLWAGNNSPRLSPVVRDLIEDTDNTTLVSMASLWEIAIKLSTGKLRINVPFTHLAVQTPLEYGLELLPIKLEHLAIISRLPYHHRDPFDRLLVAQCLAEEMTLLSADATLDRYRITRIW